MISGGTARRFSRIGYDRLVIVALLVATVLPTALIGTVASQQLSRGLEADVEERVGRAIAVVEGLLERELRDLDERARSYAGWPVLGTLALDRDHETIRHDILEFLVQRGTVDAAAVVIGGQTLASGMDVTDVLAEPLDTSGPTVDVRFTADGAAFQAVAHRLTVPVSPRRPTAPPDRVVLARRIDARFAADARRLTGFEVALLGPSGQLVVATDPTIMSRLSVDSTGAGQPRPGSGLAVGSLPLGDGSDEAAIVLVAESAALQVAAGQLPGVLLIGLIVTGLAAPAVAFGLATVLRARLRGVHDGMIAIAEGRVPPTRPEIEGDDVARLGAGLDRLVRALDHREHLLERSLDLAAALSPADAEDRIVRQATADAAALFGLEACRIEEGGDRASASDEAAAAADVADAEVVRVPLTLDPRDRSRLVGQRSARNPWTEADRAQFQVLALLIGNVLRDARLYASAADVASRLDRINRMQRVFLRSVSHNLRTPLTTIGLAAEDLAAADVQDDFHRQRIEAIRVARKRLERQVEELLVLSRIDAGTLELEPEALRLGSLVRRVWGELGLARPFELVDATDGAFAVGDIRALEQVVWIVLDNAARYAPTGLIRAVVSTASGRRDRIPDRISLTIEDEGPGVRHSERVRIFRRFARGSASSGQEGTGLGLAIARSLLRGMDGTIRYRAGELGGAAFVITLPAEPGTVGMGAASSASRVPEVSIGRS